MLQSTVWKTPEQYHTVKHNGFAWFDIVSQATSSSEILWSLHAVNRRWHPFRPNPNTQGHEILGNDCCRGSSRMCYCENCRT